MGLEPVLYRLHKVMRFDVFFPGRAPPGLLGIGMQIEREGAAPSRIGLSPELRPPEQVSAEVSLKQ